jgi:hypothetical protein
MSIHKESWHDLLQYELNEHKETFDDIIYVTLSDVELNEKFYPGYGCEEGRPFTAWTAKRVYFPVCYDGSEWVGSVPRDPCGEPTKHVGG